MQQITQSYNPIRLKCFSLMMAFDRRNMQLGISYVNMFCVGKCLVFNFKKHFIL